MITISKRLGALAGLVRQGVCVADVGCDHAKLPIYLIKSGKCNRVIASEINRPPYEKACGAVSAAGLDDRISVRMGDGLTLIGSDEADDVIIAGMGGENIADILDCAKHFHLPDKRFILQPMTRAEDLRRYLARAGFAVEHEMLVKEDDRLFLIIQVCYTGINTAEKYSDEEYLLGKYLIEHQPEHWQEHRNRLLRIKDKAEQEKAKRIIRMPLLNEITEFFDLKAPPELSAAWDNDGVMLARDKSRQVSKILLSLDLYPEAAEYAVMNGYDCIITHHPMIFRPINRLTDDNITAKKIFSLLSADISVLSYHTRLDRADDIGVNDVLARLLGMRDIEKFGDDDCPTLGRIGSIGEMSLDEVAHMARNRLPSDCVCFSGDPSKKIQRLAVVGGGGKDFIEPAIAAGADALLTGEVSYNAVLDALENGLPIITAGHYQTEAIVLQSLKKALNERFRDIFIDIYPLGNGMHFANKG